MVIETKYNIDDEVWAMVVGEPNQCRITRVDTVNIGYCSRIEYYLETGENNFCVRTEIAVFPTKEELLNSQRV